MDFSGGVRCPQIRFVRLVLAVLSGSAATSAGSDFLVEVLVL
jgi:hypothetical protein